jgi:hypothetical protein
LSASAVFDYSTLPTQPFPPILKWQKQRLPYTKAIIDPKTGDTWPMIVTTEELAYQNFLKDVIDPATNTYHKGKKTSYDPAEDGSGKETENVIEIEPYESVGQITRVKTDESKEYLLTKGMIYAFKEFAVSRNYAWSNREMWNETLFRFETDRDDSSGKLRQFCRGPEGSLIHYLIPHNASNVDKLWEIRNAKRCILVVKDAVSQEAKECPTLDMFKSKSFDYIKNMDYLSEKEKEDKLAEFQAMQGIEKTPSPKGKK